MAFSDGAGQDPQAMLARSIFMGDRHTFGMVSGHGGGHAGAEHLDIIGRAVMVQVFLKPIPALGERLWMEIDPFHLGKGLHPPDQAMIDFQKRFRKNGEFRVDETVQGIATVPSIEFSIGTTP